MSKLRFKSALAFKEEEAFQHHQLPIEATDIANDDVPGTFEFVSQSPVFLAYSDKELFNDPNRLFNVATFAQEIAQAEGLLVRGPTLVISQDVHQVLGNHLNVVVKHTSDALRAVADGQEESQVVIEQNNSSRQKWNNYFIVTLYPEANFATIQSASLVEVMRYPQYSTAENIAVLNFEINQSLYC